ncbi:MAG: iron hydrogenase small subunit [Candidatus Atribacteria bacterium]|nr:iron hydrogenase small subunit [Candidatus Atribacteria bacterium]
MSNGVEKKVVVIDGQEVALNGEKNILEVAKKANIDIPTFCYHSDLSVYGACRMCLVEVEGRGLMPSCSTPPEPGMIIRTNTARVLEARRTILELYLANHERDCTVCERNLNCRLQEMSARMGIKEVRFGERKEKVPKDTSTFSLVRDPNRCILCGDCVRACREIEGIGIYDFTLRGSKAQVEPAFGKKLSEVECVYCGQCAIRCPTAALVVKSEVDKAWEAVLDKEKFVVAQIAPAVRVAIGEAFGLPPGEITTGKIVAALKKIGFDRVYDTSFSADLTVLEEAEEFFKRLQKGERLPQFTSCCPSWVVYAERNYPFYLEHLSSARSPQQMFGSVIKNFVTRLENVPKEKIVSVSIMPCVAKKFEARRPEYVHGEIPDVDIVLSAQETIRMIKSANIDFKELDPVPFDIPLSAGSGAGVLFGVTGGVTEAVLRYAYERLTGKELKEVEFKGVRGLESVREAEVDFDGRTVKVAIVHGLARAQQLIREVREGKRYYDFIEVMSCPGGCIGGGGMPLGYPDYLAVLRKRAEGLYNADRLSPVRKAQDNPAIKFLYEQWLKHPGSETAEEHLHTRYRSRRRISDEVIRIQEAKSAQKVDVAVCVGTSCYLKGSYNLLQGLLKLIKEHKLEDKVSVGATFCLERCSQGPNIRVNDEVISGVNEENLERVFNEEILSKVKE